MWHSGVRAPKVRGRTPRARARAGAATTRPPLAILDATATPADKWVMARAALAALAEEVYVVPDMPEHFVKVQPMATDGEAELPIDGKKLQADSSKAKAELGTIRQKLEAAAANQNESAAQFLTKRNDNSKLELQHKEPVQAVARLASTLDEFWTAQVGDQGEAAEEYEKEDSRKKRRRVGSTDDEEEEQATHFQTLADAVEQEMDNHCADGG